MRFFGGHPQTPELPLAWGLGPPTPKLADGQVFRGSQPSPSWGLWRCAKLYQRRPTGLRLPLTLALSRGERGLLGWLFEGLGAKLQAGRRPGGLGVSPNNPLSMG